METHAVKYIYCCALSDAIKTYRGTTCKLWCNKLTCFDGSEDINALTQLL